MTVNKAIDFRTFSGDCEALRASLVTKGDEFRAASADLKTKLEQKNDACAGFMQNIMRSRSCEDAIKAHQNASDTFNNKQAEYASLENQFKEAGCQPTASGEGCSLESYNFKDCWDDVSVILSCSENTPKIIEKCCILERKIQYYTALHAAILTQIGQNSACLAASNNHLKAVKAAKGVWSDHMKTNTRAKTKIWNNGILPVIQSYLQGQVEAGNVTSINLVGGNLKYVMNEPGQDHPLQMQQMAIDAMAHALKADTIISMLGIPIPTLAGSTGITPSMAPQTVVCGPIPDVPTDHFCFTPEEGKKIENGVINLQKLIDSNTPDPKYIASKYSKLTTINVNQRKPRYTGGSFIPKDNFNSEMRIFFEKLGNIGYKFAEGLYSDINAAQLKKANEILVTRDQVFAMLQNAKAEQSGLLGEIEKSKPVVNEQVQNAVEALIIDNIVSSTTFSYTNKDGRIIVERQPKEGFTNGGYVVVDQGFAQIDVDAIEAQFPANDAIEIPNTAKQLNGTAELGSFTYPVTVNSQVKIQIPEEKLEAFRDAEGMNKLSKATQDSIINGLSALSCGTTLQYCIGQSIE